MLFYQNELEVFIKRKISNPIPTVLWRIFLAVERIKWILPQKLFLREFLVHVFSFHQRNDSFKESFCFFRNLVIVRVGSFMRWALMDQIWGLNVVLRPLRFCMRFWFCDFGWFEWWFFVLRFWSWGPIWEVIGRKVELWASSAFRVDVDCSFDLNNFGSCDFIDWLNHSLRTWIWNLILLRTWVFPWLISLRNVGGKILSFGRELRVFVG